VTEIGGVSAILDAATIGDFVRTNLAAEDVDGRSVCVIVPDATRTCPLPELLEAVRDALVERVTRLTVVVALGTHQPLHGDRLTEHVVSRSPKTRA